MRLLNNNLRRYLLSFVETPRKFIIAIINLRGVSTKLNKYIVFTMQTYKKLTNLRRTTQVNLSKTTFSL